MDNTIALDIFLEAYLGLNRAWCQIDTAKMHDYYDKNKLEDIMQDIWGIQSKIFKIREEIHNKERR